MFKRIYIHNYKCLVNFDLGLQKTVLLLGPNGVGKTAVLDVVFGLRKLLAGEAKINDRAVFHPSTLTRWQTRRDQVFELEAEVGGESFTYRLEVEHDEGGRRARIVKERLVGGGTKLFGCELGEVQLFRDDGSEGAAYSADWSESALARVVPQASNTRLTAFMDAVRDTVVCAVRPARLRAESLDENSLLDRYGENFVDWYRHALQENPMTAYPHVKALRPVIDGFNNARLQRSGLDSRALILDFVAGGDGTGPGGGRYDLRFDELSDGQRVLVVLYALLHLRGDNGGVMFLDEPDNFVALPEIQPWLAALVDLCEETPSQAVICSHHPELIDYLGPDYGLVLSRESPAVTTARPIAASDIDSGIDLSESAARNWIEEPSRYKPAGNLRPEQQVLSAHSHQRHLV